MSHKSMIAQVKFKSNLCLLVLFADNSLAKNLDSVLVQQNVGSDMDPDCLMLLHGFLKIMF